MVILNNKSTEPRGDGRRDEEIVSVLSQDGEGYSNGDERDEICNKIDGYRINSRRFDDEC